MVESIERCATCDRDECRSGEPRAPEYLAAAERILAANGHATLADREIIHRHARQRNAADVDCTAHRVDWRARAIAAEADAARWQLVAPLIERLRPAVEGRDVYRSPYDLIDAVHFLLAATTDRAAPEGATP